MWWDHDSIHNIVCTGIIFWAAMLNVDGCSVTRTSHRPPPPWEWTEFFSHLPSLSGAVDIGNMATYLNFKCSFMTFYTLCCCAWHMWHDTCSSSTQYSSVTYRYIGSKEAGSCVSLKIMIRGWSLAKLVTISRMVRMVIPYYGILYGGQCCVNVVLC